MFTPSTGFLFSSKTIPVTLAVCANETNPKNIKRRDKRYLGVFKGCYFF